MPQFQKVRVAGQPVRFTENGQVLVLDAIRIVSDTKNPETLWNNFKNKFPQVGNLCEVVEVLDDKSQPVLVANRENIGLLFAVLYRFLASENEEFRLETISQ